MRPDPLEKLLREYASESLPDASEKLSADVWREIDRRRTKPDWLKSLSRLSWRDLFAEPYVATAAFACAFAVGVLPAVALTKTHTDQRLARQSLHFDVFAVKATKQFTSLLLDTAETGRVTLP